MRITHCLSSRISHLHRLKQLGPCLWMGQVKSCSVLSRPSRCRRLMQTCAVYCFEDADHGLRRLCGRRKLSPARPDHTSWLRKRVPELPAPIDSEWCLLCESKQCVRIIFGGNRANEQAIARASGWVGQASERARSLIHLCCYRLPI